MNDELLTIQEAASYFGVSTRTLRRWEEKGLLKPHRTMGNQRRYSKAQLANVFKSPDAHSTPHVSPVAHPVKEEKQREVFPARKMSEQGIAAFAQEDTAGTKEPVHEKSVRQPLPQWQQPAVPLPKHHKKEPAMLMTLLGGMVSGVLVLMLVALLFTVSPSLGGSIAGMTAWLSSPREAAMQENIPTQGVLAAGDRKPLFELRVNVPGVFGKKVAFLDSVAIEKGLTVEGESVLNGGIVTNNADIDAGTGEITASNIIYSIVAGSNVTVSGDPQNPTISADLGSGAVTSLQGQSGAITLAEGSGIGLDGLTISNTGVLSLGGQTGDVTLSAGSGISVSGTTISNTDAGSAQNIFKTFTIAGTDIEASTNDDTFTFAAGSGISLSGDAGSKTLTITSTSSSGLSGLTTNGVLYATDATTATTTTPGTTGTVLKGVTGGAPVFSAVDLTADVTGVLPIANGGTGASGTPTNGQLLIGNGTNYTIGNLTGTANQINISNGAGSITFSTPQDIATTSTPTFGSLNLTAATNQLVLSSGNTGTISLASLTSDRTFTFPDQSGEVCLTSGNCSGSGGAISGSGTTNFIAKFTSSSGISDSSIFDDGTGVGIGTTSPTGLFSVEGASAGQALVSLNETGNQDILVGSASGTTRFVFDRLGNLNISGGSYQINDNSVLSTTTLGGGVVNSSLTSVGILSGGSIASDFGNIDVGIDSIAGGDITSTGTTGFTANGTGGGLTFSGTGNHAITASAGTLQLGAATLTGAIIGNSQNLTGLSNLSASGTITFGGLSAGIVKSNGSGVLSSGAVDLATGEVTGILGVTNGGTGLDNFATGDLIYASGANTLAARTVGSDGQILTVSGGLPVWSSAGGTINFWQRSLGAVAPLDITNDFLIGGAATSSALFRVSGTTGDASTSGTLTFDTTGTIQTTDSRALMLGGGTTGNITLSPQGGSGTVTSTGNLVLASGKAYQINGTNVLTGTALGSLVVSSSLEEVGALTQGSIASGFGTISTGNSISGTVINGSTSINTGGTARIDSSGNLTSIGSTQFNTITYNWPGVDGSNEYVLTTNGSGGLAWQDITGVGGAGDITGIGDVSSGEAFTSTGTQGTALYFYDPEGRGQLNIADLSQARTYTLPNEDGTICLDSGNCAGSGGGVIGSGTAGQIAYFDGAGSITSEGSGFAWDATNNRLGIGNNTPLGKLDISGASTGNALAVFNETGDQDILTASASGTTRLVLSRSGNLNIIGGAYQISGTSVLSSTTLGSNVVNSDLTKVGTLAQGSISSNFGAIDIGPDNLTAGGTITFGGLSTGVVQSNGTGVLSSSAIDLSDTNYVTGTLGVSNGGTGVNASTVTDGQILIGNNAANGFTLAGLTGGTAISVVNGAGSITINNTGVTSLAGTTNQISATSSTGSITLSLPQDIHSAATPSFAALNLTNNTNPLVLGTTNTGTVTLDSLTGPQTYTFPNASGEICLDSGNCSGAGGGITGSGAAGQIAYFSDADSITSEAEFAWDTATDSLDIAGGLTAGTTNAFSVSTTGVINTLTDETINGIDISSGTVSDVANLTINTGGDLTIGSIGLNDVGTTNITSGASLVGVFDEFTNSNSTTVQDVLDDLDSAIGAGSSKFTDAGTFTYLTDTTDSFTLGSSTLELGKMAVVGDADEIQFVVRGNATQTNNIAVFEDSTGTDQFTIANNGNVTAAGTGSFADIACSSTTCITLGTETGGDYVASLTAGAGLTGTATGEGSTPTLAIGAGNGITVNADDITVDATTTGTTATTSSNSGLEVTASGIRLLGGCSASQILKWNSTSSIWECGNDSGGSGTAAIVNIENNDAAVGSDVDTIDFSTDFSLAASPSNEANVSIADDALDFTEFSDSLGLDAATLVALGNFNFTLGDSTGTGGLVVAPNAGGNSALIVNKQGTNGDILTASASGTTRLVLTSGGNLNIIGGAYQIGGTNVLTADTLGALVVNSDLTSVGTLDGGAISANFGAIDVGTDSISTTGTGSFGDIACSSTTCITLGTETGGDYVASLTAGAGLTGTATGEGSTPTLAIGAGNGITVNTDDVAVDATTTGTTATTSSNSGIEATAGGIRLFGGCSDNQILKWDSDTSVWSCATDAGGTGTAGVVNIENNDAAVGTDVDTIDFSTDFNVAASPTNEANVSLADDAIDFTEISDSLSLDAATAVALSTFNFTLGTNAGTGGLIIAPNAGGNSALIVNKQGTNGDILTASASGTTQLTLDRSGNLAIEGQLSDLSQTTLTINDNLSLASGDTYQINGTEVLSATTLGLNVVNSSLTQVGALNEGSIEGSFGTISTSNTIQGSNITASGTTGFTASGIGADLTFSGTGTHTISASAGTLELGALTLAGAVDGGTQAITNLGQLVVDTITIDGSTISASGDITLNPTGGNVLFADGDRLNVGGGAAAAYNFFADSVASGVDIADGDSDLFIGDELEVNGAVRFDSSSFTLGNAAFANCSTLETASGVLSCGTDDGGVNYWQLNQGAISPFSESADLLIGSTASNSAEFAILNVNNGTPTASISAVATGNGISLAGDGKIQSLRNNTLTIGGNTTGNITLSPLNGAGTVTTDGDLNLTTGNTFKINNVDVLSATTLGANIVTSSLDSVDALNAGTITSGFGSIDIGSDSITGGNLTGSGTTGLTLSGSTAGITFSNNSTHLISASAGTLQLGALTLTGSITGNSQTITGLGQLGVDSLTLDGTTLSSTGDININPTGGDVIFADTATLNIGGNASDVAYNVIGDSTSGAGATMTSDDDLYIEGNLEVDGTLTATVNFGLTQGSVAFIGSGGNITQDNTNFFWDDTTNELGIGTNTPDATLDVNGTVIIGTATDGITFDPASGPDYNGTARPSKTISLQPEYSGAVLSAFYGVNTDSNITGFMTSDIETSGSNNLRSYYEWERTTSTQHFYTVAVRVKLPKDFAAWTTSNALQIDYRTENATSTNSDLDIYVYLESDGTLASPDASSTNLTSTSWTTQSYSASDLTEVNAADETAVIFLRMGSQNGNYVRVGEIRLNYLASF